MAGNYREDVALFSKTHGTYTEEHEPPPEVGDTPTGDEPKDQQEQSKHDYPQHNGAQTGQGKLGDPCHESTQTGAPEPYAIPPFDEMLCHINEKAINAVGFGRLQWVLFVILGLGLMGDGIELMMVAYIFPGAEKDLCMNAEMKGWLGAIAFAGMMIGAVIWGNLADKVGRKPMLITSLTVNVIFAVIGAFVPTYWLFLLCRLFSGIGIGGSIPITMAYFGEFCPREGRGWKLGLLLTFWVLGGVYVSALGWAIIPNKEMFDLYFTEDATLHSWRVFILICIIPIVFSVFGLFAMPESPRFLLQVGRDLEALAVYRKIYQWNHTEPGAEYEMPEIELPSLGMVRSLQEDADETRFLPRVARALENFWNSIFALFVSPLTVTTLILCVTWFSTAFGYYGISIWFPEYIKKLEQESYFAETNMTRNQTFIDVRYTTILNNVHFLNDTFINVNFTDIELRHVTFEMCLLINCHFNNVTAKKTYFLESFLRSSSMNNTNFYPNKFQGTLLKESSINNTREGCEVDFDISYSSRQIFLENFLTQIVVLPATILSACLLDRVGRVRLLAGFLFMSAVSVFFIWFTNTEVAVVVMNGIFNCVANGAFNSIDVASTELYPTNLRATAFGFLSCLGRIGAILGNVCFGHFIDVSKAIPILITACIMAIGGLFALKLPESTNKIL